MNLIKSDHQLIYGSSMKISDNRSRLMNQETKRRADHASVIAEYRSNLINDHYNIHNQITQKIRNQRSTKLFIFLRNY